VFVEPKDPDWTGRLDVANPLMMADLAAEAGSRTNAPTDEYPFRLLCRRSMHVQGSPTPVMPENRPSYNPAYLHPSDLELLGVATGDVVEITSTRASILGVVGEDDSVRPGTVSMTHSFGDLPASGHDRDTDPRRVGSNPGRLVDNEEVYDAYSGQSRMSNVPVRIVRAPERERALSV